jgi:hypothetical protein
MKEALIRDKRTVESGTKKGALDKETSHWKQLQLATLIRRFISRIMRGAAGTLVLIGAGVIIRTAIIIFRLATTVSAAAGGVAVTMRISRSWESPSCMSHEGEAVGIRTAV